MHIELISTVKINYRKWLCTVAVLMLAKRPKMVVQYLTIEDEWGSRFDPHLGVDQVGSAGLLGAALTSHHLGYMGRLIGP